MADYLQNLGNGWRVVSAVACALASVLFLLIAVVIWSDMVRRGSFDYEGKPLWLGGVLLAIFGLTAAYLSWRLAIGSPSANGVTLLPTWFISVFGFLLLAGAAAISYTSHRPLLLFEAGSAAIGMIFVGRLIQQRQRQSVVERLACLPGPDRERIISQLTEGNQETVRTLLKGVAKSAPAQSATSDEGN